VFEVNDQANLDGLIGW